MGKVISVFGSPGSGKTTFSVKFANEIAKEKSVIVVFTDILCPVIPTILDNVDNKKSLGKILSSAQVTKDVILQNCISVNKNLGVIGYAEYENVFAYPQYTDVRAVDLIDRLRDLADYIIIDLSSNFTTDLLSTTALEISDKVIRMTSSRLKDISYFNSHLPLLSDKFKKDEHIKVISNFKSYDAIEELKEIYKIQATFGYSEEIREQGLCNELFSPLSSKEEKQLKSDLFKIANLLGKKEKSNIEEGVKASLFEKIFRKKGSLKYVR
ncbi:MAG: ParA family protein [Clostridium sp.]|uniref:ParA family protein n=1 Tax=Clostridium sp. TaxID=1506 RepID=UPI001F2DF3B3|nr:ParA family protein [Clostridium sp.]MDU4843958.1 hypothetical protein [Leclercia adecarboxylata]MDU7089585.1 ParA family protein [Clostridium sp.]